MAKYAKQGQRIYFQREGSTYGKIYDPESELTAFTSIPDDYPHWRRLDVIPEGMDIVVPVVEKLKKFDISDAKHPSIIESGNIKPVEFSLEMDAQALEFLPMAAGKPAFASHLQAMTQVITLHPTTVPDQGDYFLFDVIASTGAVVHYGVWADTAGNGSTGKPAVTGINASRMLAANVSASSDGTDVANAVELIIETTLGAAGTSDITSADNAANVITLIHARSGAVQLAHDGENAFGLQDVVASTWGSTSYTVTEGVDESLPSFTFRFEQQNATAAEDIIWDAFGCVVESVEVTLAGDGGVATYSVTFKCPYALENTTHGRADIEPPRKKIPPFPTMSSIQESDQNRLLQEYGATTTTTSAYIHVDRTPDQVDKIAFSIINNVKFYWDLSTRYATYAAAGAREIKLSVVGVTSEKELFTYFQGIYAEKASGGWAPTSASGRLNSKIKLQRDATYDYILISIYNWVIEEHDFSFASVDDAVKNVDITFSDGSSDSSGYIIDDFDYKGYIDRIVMVV